MEGSSLKIKVTVKVSAPVNKVGYKLKEPSIGLKVPSIE